MLAAYDRPSAPWCIGPAAVDPAEGVAEQLAEVIVGAVPSTLDPLEAVQLARGPAGEVA